jgi:hypothetical protein
MLKVDARSLELLCEDLGSTAENDAFNGVMHTVLGIAEQVRFCAGSVNRRYNGRQDDPKNPINCTWGFVRPPPLPQRGAGGACPATAEALLEERMHSIANHGIA